MEVIDSLSSQLVTHLPTRLATALDSLAQLNELGIILLSVRHHSPACAFATKMALDERQPNDILIEAPASFNELLADLQHPDNKPPLAVLCQTEVVYAYQEAETNNDADTEVDSEADSSERTKTDLDNDAKGTEIQKHKRLYSAYFPFCDYSPEWVALRYQLSELTPKTASSNLTENLTQTKNTSSNISPYIGFIDLPWSEQVAHRENVRSEQTWETQSLQQERYLAHSNYIKALADKLHCRDHDEVWEHLFELDSVERLSNWQAFFHKVLVWCAMSRLDYEQGVLEAESSLIREQYMVQRILERYQLAIKSNLQTATSNPQKTSSQNSSSKKNSPQKTNANIVVVTGGFHTLALIELLHDALLTNNDTSSKKIKNTPSSNASISLNNTIVTSSADESWLIRYSFDRLDALNGYASGMPSPAFYQACWQQMLTQSTTHLLNLDSYQKSNYDANQDLNQDLQPDAKLSESQVRQRLVIDLLSDFSHQLRAEQIIQSSYITVKTASEQAIRLAQLREHKLIGRFDVMDACYSSFLKDSDDNGTHSFHQLLKDKLGGARLGQVVSTSRTPPVLAQVYKLVSSQRFKLEDTLSKTAKLDVLRKPMHRQRSCLLQLLAFLDVGFARRISGPDFLHGGQLNLLFEEWLYAWTPQVEARLIILSESGSDIYHLATQRLLSQRQSFAEQAQSQSSAEVISLLIQASVMGLSEQIDVLFDEVSDILPNDPELGSVLACGQHLMYLWTGRAFLQLQKDQQLADIIAQVPVSALFLLSQLQTPNEDQIASTLRQILSLRNLLKQMNSIINDYEFNNPANSHSNPQDKENTDANGDLLAEYHLTLNRLLPSWQDIDLLLGAVHALEFIDGFSTESILAERLRLHFGAGSNPEQAVAYLSGMMQAVPTIFLHYQGMTQMLDRLVSEWDHDTFVTLLPDLRLAFTGLKPMQTNDFAQQIANLHGVSSTEVTQYQGQLGESDMLQGVALNQQLDKILESQGLKSWVL